MSLTVSSLLSDAKRLSCRLRDHDSSADAVISSAQEVLTEVEAMKQFQEEIENLNSVAKNRPRAQLVLGKKDCKNEVQSEKLKNCSRFGLSSPNCPLGQTFGALDAV